MFYIYAGGQQIYRPLDDRLIVLNPRLTLELGKAGALEFDIPPENPYYGMLLQLTTEVTVDMDDDEIFHGRVLTNERAFNNHRHVYCEGDLSYLIDSVQKGVQYNGTTHELFRRIITNHNARVDANKRFTVGTINIENRNIVLVGQSESENLNTGEIDFKQIAIDSIVDNWNNSFDYIQTCLIDYCGGYLRTRRVNGTIYIDLLDDFANTAIQPIELGTNLLDLKEEINAQDVFTVLVPLGDDNLTIASVNGGSDELADTNAVARFGRIVRTHVFNNVTSASTLLENAQRYLATNVNVPRTISVRAVDLHLLNKLVSPIRIGDKVTINSSAHDVNDALTCTRIEYDLERPENNNYTFGNPKQTLTQRYREDVRLSNDTYGNSAASPSTSSAASPSAASAKGAAAAGAAGKAAEKAKDDSLNKFFDAWIDVKPEQGTVKLGALHRDYINGKEVLLSQCGIDLDGSTGNVNIQSLHNVVDDHGHLIAENTAHIGIVETDTAVAIESVTERIDHLAGEEAEHYTAITQRADTLGSSIDLLARDVHEFEDGTTTALTNINMVANDHESRITSNTNFVSTLDGKVTNGFTSVKQITDDHESRIQSNAAFTTEVDGKLTTAVNSITQITDDHESRIQSNAQFISNVDNKYTKAVNNILQITDDHESKIASNTSFLSKIDNRESQHYTAITQKSTALESSIQSHTSAISDLNSYYTAIDQRSSDNSAAIKIVAGDAKTNKDNIASITLRVTNNESEIALKANKVYVDGKFEAATASINDLTTGKTTAAKIRATDIIAGSISLFAEGAAGKVATFAHAHTIAATEQTGGKIQISMGNASATVPQKTTFDIAATKFYKDGVAAVKVTSLDYYTVSGEETVTYDSSKKTLNVMVKATLSNNNQNGNVRTVTGVPANLAFDAGKTEGRDSVKATAPTLDTSWSTSSTGYTYQSASKRYLVRAKSNASDGNGYTDSKAGNLYVSASAAINAGATTAYFSKVTTEAAGEPSYNSEDNVYYANVKVSGTARGTKADGTYYTATRDITTAVDVTAVYTAGKTTGKTEGRDSVKATAPTLDTSWSTSSTGYIYRSANKQYEVRVKSNAGDGNGYTDSKSGSVYVSAAAAINAGATTAVVSTITVNSASAPAYDDEDGHWYSDVSITATARATKADGTYYTKSDTKTKSVNVDAAYSKGYNTGVDTGAMTAAVSTITVNSATTPTYDAEDGHWYSDVSITATARGTKADGTYYTKSDTKTKSVNVDAAYSKGSSDGEAGVTADSGSVSYYSFNSSYYMYNFDYDVTLSNGETYTLSGGLSAGDAINYGKSLVSGYDNITFSITDQQTSSKIGITVVVTGRNTQTGQYKTVASGGPYWYNK